MIIKKSGRTITIPDSELKDLMEALECDQETALETWLEDHEIETSAESAELHNKAKGHRPDRGIKGSKLGEKRKPVKRKISNEKQELFATVYNALTAAYPAEDITVMKENKMIAVKAGDVWMKVDFIQCRTNPLG